MPTSSRNAEGPTPGSEANTEIEIKLLCDAGQLADIIAAPEIARYGRDAGEESTLTAIYYDTPEFDLHKSGAALRVRTDGTGFVMTLKSKKEGNGKALERTEKDTSIESMVPDLAALSHMLTAKAFARIENKPLVQIFSTEVRRHTRMLHTPLGIVELAVDQGCIVAGEHAQTISEVELELVEGRTEALLQLAQELVSRFHLRPSTSSKATRGFDLARDAAPGIAKARKMAFANGVTLDQALDTILHTAIQHLLENQPAAEDGREPEGIHQYRIALRRLRSVLGLIRLVAPSAQLEMFRDDAKWLMSGLNEARDWDVFVTQSLPMIALACPAVAGFDALGSTAQRHRDTAHAAARAALTDARTGRFQIRLGLWVEQKGWRADASPDGLSLLQEPARVFATEILDKLQHKALKKGRQFQTLEPEERHELRITIKKLRYAADFFLPLLGKAKRYRPYAKILSVLQDRLGHHNDLAVTERLIQPIVASEISRVAHQAAGAVLGWQSSHSNRDDGALLAAWKKFRNPGFSRFR